MCPAAHDTPFPALLAERVLSGLARDVRDALMPTLDGYIAVAVAHHVELELRRLGYTITLTGAS